MFNNKFFYTIFENYEDRKENKDKIIKFSKKWNVYNNEKCDISYDKCIELVQTFLYYKLEEKYVNFILEFHKSHNTKHKIYPPKLVFRKLMKSKDKNINISLKEERKFKISELLKNM